MNGKLIWTDGRICTDHHYRCPRCQAFWLAIREGNQWVRHSQRCPICDSVGNEVEE